MLDQCWRNDIDSESAYQIHNHHNAVQFQDTTPAFIKTNLVLEAVHHKHPLRVVLNNEGQFFNTCSTVS